MKRITLIFTLVLIISGFSLNAQRFYLGPAFGLNLSTISGYNYHFSEPHDMNGQFIGIKTGLIGMYEIYDGWTIQTELLYSRKGHRLDLNWDTTDYSQNGYRRLALSYFEVPVLAKKFFGDGGVRMYVNAGPYWGYWLGATDKYKLTQYFPDSEEDISTTDKIDLNSEWSLPGGTSQRWDMGLILGGGFAYETGPGYLLIDIKYATSYRDLLRWEDESLKPEDYRELMNKYFSISFGYTFEF